MHRAYIGWFEQICRELSGDPEFALPYWDWTAEPRIPKVMFEHVLDPNNDAFHRFGGRLQKAVSGCNRQFKLLGDDEGCGWQPKSVAAVHPDAHPFDSFPRRPVVRHY
ncbi:tyrosinase family protein [Bradyrhizobium sp. CNPSo 4026]|nr:tyrosinase family protein [Bradyrhizobium cenepequi]